MQTKRKFKKLPVHLCGLSEKRNLLRVLELSPGKWRIAGLLFFAGGGKDL